MNQPKYTAAPIVCEPEGPFSLKSLFMGHRRSTRYYEAADSGGGLYLLWMEYSRFGVLMAYPCALSEAGGEPLFFDTSPDPAAGEKNDRLTERWNALSLPDKKDSLTIRRLSEKDFKEAFRRFREAHAG